MVQNAVAEAEATHSLNRVLSQTFLIQNPGMIEKFSLLPRLHQIHKRETSGKKPTRNHGKNKLGVIKMKKNV